MASFCVVGLLISSIQASGGRPARFAALAVRVSQRYEGRKRLRYPIARAIERILRRIGLRVTRRTAAGDATLRVQVRGSGLGGRYSLTPFSPYGGTWYFTGAELAFEVGLTDADGKRFKGNFQLIAPIRRRIRKRWGSHGCRSPSCAPYWRAWRRNRRDLAEGVLDFVYRIAGVAPLASALGHRSRRLPGAAEKVLKGIKGLRDPQPIVKLLTSRRWRVRARATRVLGVAVAASPETIAALRKRLGDHTRTVRRAAALALGKLGDRASAGAVAGLLGGAPEKTREEARRLLTHLAGPEVLAALRALLRDPKWKTRVRAAQALVEAMPLEGREIAALHQDKSVRVRRVVAQALGDVPSAPSVLAALKALEGDKDRRVREAALEATRRVRRTEEVREEIEHQLSESRAWRATGALQKLSRRQRDAVFSLFARSSSARARSWLARQVGVPPGVLLQLLADPQSRVRAEAARSLARVWKPKALLPPLRDRLTDSDPGVRSAVARSLAKLGDRFSIPVIVPVLVAAPRRRGGDDWRILRRLSGPRLLQALSKLLRNPTPEVRVRAVLALAEAMPEAAWGSLATLLKDPSPKVRVAASRRIAATPRRGGSPSEPVRELLRPLLQDPSPEVRAVAVGFLARAGDGEGVKAAVRQVAAGLRGSAGWSSGTWKAKGVLDRLPEPARVRVLNALLRDGSAAVRRGVARLVGQLKLAGCGEALIANTRDQEPSVRAAAAAALGALPRDRPASEALRPLLADPSPQVGRAAKRALLALGDPEVAEAEVRRLLEGTSVRPRGQRDRSQREGLDRWARRFPRFARYERWRRIRASRLFRWLDMARGALLGLADTAKAALLDRLLRDPKAVVREGAALLVGRELGASAVGRIARLLGDAEPAVRDRAARELGRLGRREAVGPLVEALADPDQDVRSMVQDALRRITNLSLGNDPDAWRRWWKSEQEGGAEPRSTAPGAVRRR